MAQDNENEWQLLTRAGAVGAFGVVAMIPIQIVFFIVSPPTFEVTAAYATFDRDWLLGLESFDVLLVVDSILSLVFFLALTVVLWRQQSLALLAIVAVIAGTASYFSANTSFELFDLAKQYAATNEGEVRSQLLAAGRFALAHFQGTGFVVYYLLGAIATIAVSAAMLRGAVFGRATGWIGVIAGVTMLVPPIPATGQAGLVASLFSLVPLVGWLALAGWRLWHLSDASGPRPSMR